MRGECCGVLEWRKSREFLRDGRRSQNGDPSSVAERGIGVNAEWIAGLIALRSADGFVRPREIRDECLLVL